MSTKYENEKLEFAVNVPEVVTLDTDPTQAKEYSKTFKNEDGTDYESKSYMYFAKGKKIFFAPEKLHDFLLKYKKGDTVTITKGQEPGQRAINWRVEAGAQQNGNSTPDDGAVARIENKLDTLISLVSKLLNEKNPSVASQPAQPTSQTPSTDDEDLGF